MAGVCTTCKRLRINLNLKRCVNARFFPPKPKHTVPAAFISSFSFLGYGCSSDDRISSDKLWNRGRTALEDFSLFCKGSRSLSSSVFLLQRERGETKPGSGKIKAKIEQMKEMKEDIFTIPNMLSSLRILATPFLGYLIVTEDFVSSIALFGVAGITDLLDGFIARNFKNQKSVLGTILDPLADKILISVLTVSLTMVSLLPVPLTVLILSRDALLICYAFYIRFKSLPSPKSVSRYFDINMPTVELRPNLLGKANTVLQLALVGSTLAAPVMGFVDHPYLYYLWHIKEHLKDEIGDVKEDELSDQDLLFHYFRLHDYDNNRKLDGLELMQAMNDYHKESGVEDEKETSEEAVAYTVDRILKYDDTNNDGYIDYPEYINAQGEHLV